MSACWSTLVLLLTADILRSSESFGAVGDLVGFEGEYMGGSVRGYWPSVPTSGSPVFLYLSGNYDAFDTGVDCMFSKQMALRGYIAARVQYDNWDGSWPWGNFRTNFCELRAKTAQIFEGPGSALTFLCNLSGADCSKGVAVMGHSHGAFVASFSPEFAPVTALLSLSSGTHNTFWLWGSSDKPLDCLTDESVSKHLPRVKRRSITGNTDYLFGTNEEGVILQQKTLSGYDCNSERDCIQADGSGYYVISEKELGVRADHGIFADFQPVLKTSAFLCPFLMSSGKWAMVENLNWLAGAASVGAKTANLTMNSVFDAECINIRRFGYIPLDELAPNVLLGLVVLVQLFFLLCSCILLCCWCYMKDRCRSEKAESSQYIEFE